MGFAMEYSERFKASLVRRMAGPRAVSASALEAEVGVPQPTLSRWLREAGSVGGMADDDGKASAKTRPRKTWTATEKMRVLFIRGLTRLSVPTTPVASDGWTGRYSCAAPTPSTFSDARGVRGR